MKKQHYQVTKLCDERITSLLKECDHKLVARWAFDAGMHVLDLFEGKNLKDSRPREALQALQGWLDGKISVSEARKFALSAHKAAQYAVDPASIAAARASGHACAVAHVKTHANGVAMYSVLATMYHHEGDPIPETEWQYRHLIELMNMKS